VIVGWFGLGYLRNPERSGQKIGGARLPNYRHLSQGGRAYSCAAGASSKTSPSRASLSPRLFAAESRCKIMSTARQRLGTRAPWIPIRVGRCVTYSACRSLAPPRAHSPIRRFVPTACPSESLQAKRNRPEGNRPEKRHWHLLKPHK
jgi:hypothetical protein